MALVAIATNNFFGVNSIRWLSQKNKFRHHLSGYTLTGILIFSINITPCKTYYFLSFE